jgi:hypothetical protein
MPYSPIPLQDALGLLDERPQLGLHHGPRHQPLLVGYGDGDRLSHHAVLAPDHLVREASRPLVADESRAVLLSHSPGPLQQRRGFHGRGHAEDPHHDIVPSVLARSSKDGIGRSPQTARPNLPSTTIRSRVVPVSLGPYRANSGWWNGLEGYRYALEDHPPACERVPRRSPRLSVAEGPPLPATPRQ